MNLRAAGVALPALFTALGACSARVEGALVAAGCAALVGTLALAAPRRVGADLFAVLLSSVVLGVLLVAGYDGVPAPWSVVGLVAGVQLAATGVRRAAPRVARSAAPWCAAAFVLASAGFDLFGAAPAAFARTDPDLGARVLDAAPATLLAESAGLDWMRHPAVYAPAGTDWFSDRRAPFDGSLAALVALVVGCTSFGLSTLRRVEPAQER